MARHVRKPGYDEVYLCATLQGLQPDQFNGNARRRPKQSLRSAYRFRLPRPHRRAPFDPFGQIADCAGVSDTTPPPSLADSHTKIPRSSRLRDLADRRLYAFHGQAVLAGIVCDIVDAVHVRVHLVQAPRIAVSGGSGPAFASGMLRRNVTYPRQNGLPAALQESGRVERSLFTLD